LYYLDNIIDIQAISIFLAFMDQLLQIVKLIFLKIIRIEDMRKKRKNISGFTLIELMIVVGMIGILTAIAVPSILNWLPNMRIKAAARDVYSSMQQARMMAAKTNNPTAITFDTANNRYVICNQWDSAAGNCTGSTRSVMFNNYKSGIGYGHGNSTKQANSTGAAWPLAPDDDVSYIAPGNVVVFNSRGLCSGGYVYLDHKDQTTTYAVGSQTSGVIKLLRWTGNTWK